MDEGGAKWMPGPGPFQDLARIHQLLLACTDGEGASLPGLCKTWALVQLELWL